MAAHCNKDMWNVLKKVGLDEFAVNFDKQKVSPDIVCFLSAQELHQLGLSRKEEMVKLRMECIKYGANQPQMRMIKSGPPEFVIPKCILQNLIDGFLISDIAKLLSVSESTIYRRMRQHDITKVEFSNMNDDEIGIHVGKVIKEFPFCGENILRQILKLRGVYVQRWRLRDIIHCTDEKGVEERKKGRLQRRVYNVKGPNHLWHIDTNHKFFRWHMVIAGGIDGFSRLIVYLQCKDNNRAETIFQCFLTAVEKFGIPQRVRSDKGLENVYVANYMIQQRGAGRGIMITGKSVHNQRIESLWRDVYLGVLVFYYNLFYFMEDEGILDPLNDMHIAALHKTFLPKINEKLDIWREAWARHKMRTVHSSPRTLWIAGQLQVPAGISISDMDNYGAEGIMNTNAEYTVENARPVFNCPEYNLSNQCRQHLETDIHASWVSHNFGIDIYLKALDIIRIHSNDV